MRKAIAAAFSMGLILATSNIAAQTNNPPPKPPSPAAAADDPAASQGVRKLSRREKKEAMSKLSEKYQTFLKEVEPIMLPSELNAFLLLESDPQRDLFIESFWARRNPDPKSGHNEYRDRYADLLEEARAQFKQLSSDRARIFLSRGRPDNRLQTECDKYLVPMEIWQYGFLPGMGHNQSILFYRDHGADYRLWIPIGMGDDSLKDLISSEAIASTAGGTPEDAAAAVFSSGKLITDCKDGREILNAIYQSRQNTFQLNQIFEPPKVNEEDVNAILRTAVIANPSAPKLTAEVSASYPGRKGSRTTVNLDIVVPRSQLETREIDGVRYYNLDVNGEVLKEGKLYETYRYRYDFPAKSVQEKVPMEVERYLRPADYVSRLKVADANSGAEAVVESNLSVPAIEDDPVLKGEKIEGGEAVDRLQAEFIRGESSLRIVPLPNELLTGLQHIETIVGGEKIKSVEFYLDGRKVMTKRSAPFSLDLDLGNVPQLRKVKAVGLDEKDAIIAGDEIIVNGGQDPFRVRIVSPRIAANVSGKVRVEIDPAVPEGKTLDRVELYLNETRLATLYNPPWVQTINVPANLGIAYLRAVATLKDPTVQPSEDVVFLNSPQFLQQVEVHLIELPTTVLSKGHPLLGLSQSAFRIKDQGTPVKIAKFEYVKNVPLSLGLAIDSSSSMRPRMAEAQRAGAEFFKSVLKSGDQAFIVAFDTRPAMLQKWTRNLADLNAGLASLRAEEATALYDAIVYSLYNFQNVKGQRAVVVITDGKDTASQFTFDQAIEYAKRTGIPIYSIGIGIRASEVETRFKLSRFSAETGGNTYYIEDVSKLAGVYAEIQNELRSQYLLGFYPPESVQPGGKWREVTVEVTEGKAKTIRGYYP